MAFTQTHFLITSLILVFINNAVSLTFNFTKINSSTTQELVLQGADNSPAYISPSGIQVTPNEIGSVQSSKAGRATYQQQLHLWDNGSGELASFSTSFTFVIDSNDTNHGDGLTFFLAQDNPNISTGGAMGLPVNMSTMEASSRFVAVEFDMYWNYVWDPKDGRTNGSFGDHVGIDISSITSVRYQRWFSNITGGGECQAWITYDSVSNNLSVSFTGYGNGEVVHQDGLFYIVDLRKELPEWVIFGFSAATGLSFQTNNVRSWTFNSSVLKVDENNQISAPAPTPTPTIVPVVVSNEKKSMVGLIVGIPVAVISLLIFSFVLWRWHQKKIDEEEEESPYEIEMNNEFEMGTGPKRFCYHELAHSTDDFAEKEKLGEGGFGGVYRGFLKESNMYIAVKRVSKGSKQGMKEYASEVRIITRLRHRNLVQLIGWCHQKGELLLVYEYMENGSLDFHLFKGKSLLTWGTRYQIVHGLASALLYLHEEWEQCVLHRDIKSSNVMLDTNFNAKLGDFGLAKLVDHEKDSQTMMLAGTVGYMAPECMITGKSTKESDVFSFGVVALEIACGRKSIENKAPENQVWLTQWVWELYGSETLVEAVDPNLQLDYEEEQEIKRLMVVGLWCAHPDSKYCPKIIDVIKVLKGEAYMPFLTTKMHVSSLFGYNSSNSISSKQTTSSTISSSSSQSASLLHSMQ